MVWIGDGWLAWRCYENVQAKMLPNTYCISSCGTKTHAIHKKIEYTEGAILGAATAQP